jgi:hypothetical protein
MRGVKGCKRLQKQLQIYPLFADKDAKDILKNMKAHSLLFYDT